MKKGPLGERMKRIFLMFKPCSGRGLTRKHRWEMLRLSAQVIHEFPRQGRRQRRGEERIASENLSRQPWMPYAQPGARKPPSVTFACMCEVPSKSLHSSEQGHFLSHFQMWGSYLVPVTSYLVHTSQLPTTQQRIQGLWWRPLVA